MSIQRTPPKSNNSSNLTNTPLLTYGSDSQLYVSPPAGQNDHITRRIKRKHLEHGSAASTVTSDEIKDIFATFEAQQNLKFEKLMESMSVIKNQNNEIQKSMEFLSSKYDEVLEKMLKLEEKNKCYERKIESLESKIELLERNSRSSIVEIRNIPKQDPENKTLLCALVQKVGDVISQPLTKSDIHDVYRLKTKKESNCNNIVVNFTTTLCKDGFIKQSRNYNKMHRDNKLNTSHLQLPGPLKPIFIDESLTSLGRRLAYLARQFIAEHKYHSTWTSYGKIFIKKTHDSPALRVDCEQDLEKLLNK